MAESAQAERERQDQERAADNLKRQARQGIEPVEAAEESEEENEAKPKAKAKKSE